MDAGWDLIARHTLTLILYLIEFALPMTNPPPPFVPQVVENGSVYDCMVLDIKDEDLLGAVAAALANVAAIGLEINFPTLASLPHSIINGYKNVLAISLGTDYDFPLSAKVKEILANPSAFAAAAPTASAAAPAAKKEEKKVEEEEEEEMEFSLFD